MQVTRRQFLVGSAVASGGLALASLGIDVKPAEAYVANMTKIDKLRSATQSTSICCYCSCGCSVICSTDEDGKIFHIEGDPDHPINEGTLCPKGAALMQTTEANEHRLTKVQYRAPGSDHWEEKDWDWALDRMARLIKDTRDVDFVEKNSKDLTVNRVETIAHGGSSNVDNEECFMMASVARALGLVYIDHQARV
jgi:formate dehydrogenase major subunit